LRDFLPPIPDDITVVEDWDDALPKIVKALGI
jgi:hypothetical protein